MIYIHTLIVLMIDVGAILALTKEDTKFATFLAVLFTLLLFTHLALAVSYATYESSHFYINWLKEVI